MPRDAKRRTETALGPEPGSGAWPNSTRRGSYALKRGAIRKRTAAIAALLPKLLPISEMAGKRAVLVV